MRLNPKEILSTVAGTVLVLVAIFAANAERRVSSITTDLKAPEVARGETECEFRG